VPALCSRAAHYITFWKKQRGSITHKTGWAEMMAPKDTIDLIMKDKLKHPNQLSNGQQANKKSKVRQHAQARFMA
jgi:hypothetical protein